MSCWALLALKPPQMGKSRLCGRLTPPQREHLILTMFEHVLASLTNASEIDRIAVVTPVPEMLPRQVLALRDCGTGLNQALDDGRKALLTHGATELLVLHADLPWLSPAEVDRFVRHGRKTGLALASDHHGSGTNAIFLSRLDGFDFHFGAHSFKHHLAEARTRGLEPIINAPRGFAVDIDEPADLQHYLDTRGGLLEPRLSPWSTTRWTARLRHFLPLHMAEHG
ncbi:MAG: 2-phospho-L-lactate guanylyltransferase [Thauera sp.]|nr:2-phospho-L-lactate guanylyltransferase [Thauera sp.]